MSRTSVERAGLGIALCSAAALSITGCGLEHPHFKNPFGSDAPLATPQAADQPSGTIVNALDRSYNPLPVHAYTDLRTMGVAGTYYEGDTVELTCYVSGPTISIDGTLDTALPRSVGVSDNRWAHLAGTDWLINLAYVELSGDGSSVPECS
ncbi:MAG TPA: hypothetical protein VJP80_04825 [Candidatus Saccharimonadales bacterium]|nr:hypothetical protein [Candidatus Saccharimonadales bacterium]